MLRYPDLVTIYCESEKHDFSASYGQFADAEYLLHLADDRLKVNITADETPLLYLRLRWRFTTDERRTDRVRIYGDAWERAGGTLEWRGIVPERVMPWFMLVSNGSDADTDVQGRRTDAYGVCVQPNAFCFWQYDTAGVTLWIDLRNGGSGVLLKGRTLEACTVLFRTYEHCSAFAVGEQFCSEMSPTPKLPPEPIYGANNWYYAYGRSSHDEILTDTDIVAKLCAGNHNRPYMVIDDGWSPNPKNGPWTHGNERFPDMQRLATEIRAKGVRPGIWVRYIYDESNVCGLPADWHYPHDRNFLDPSHPAVLDYIADTTRRFADWGYELIKFDCSTQDILGRRGYRTPDVIAPDGWHFYDRTKTSAEIILNFYRTIRQAAGENVILLGCATISHLSAGIVEVGRTGADINGMNWDITRRMGVNTLAFRMMLNRRLFAVDADCVGITEWLPWYYNRQWLELLAASGTPLFVSCKPGILDKAGLEELADAYRRNSAQTDCLIPLDWMENICPERWLLNGKEITFEWFDDSINAGFQGESKL